METTIPLTKSTGLLRAKDVAQRLNISRSKAYQLMQSGDIPTVRFGGSVRVLECDLDDFIHQSRIGGS